MGNSTQGNSKSGIFKIWEAELQKLIVLKCPSSSSPSFHLSNKSNVDLMVKIPRIRHFLKFTPVTSVRQVYGSDLTAEAVWRPQWPHNLIFFVGLKLMEILMMDKQQHNNKQISPKFLKKFSKNLQECIQKSFKISPKNEILHFLPCQQQVYQVRTLFIHHS